MIDERARSLADAFDRAFAEALAGPRPDRVDLLRIAAGGDLYAIALADVASVHAGLAVCPVPTPAPALRGLAAVRGTILPVYDLAALLGATGTGDRRWCVVARDGAAAFVFDGFEGLFRVAPAAIAAAPGPDRLVRGAVIDGGGSVPLIDLAAVARSVSQRKG